MLNTAIADKKVSSIYYAYFAMKNFKMKGEFVLFHELLCKKFLLPSAVDLIVVQKWIIFWFLLVDDKQVNQALDTALKTDDTPTRYDSTLKRCLPHDSPLTKHT